MQITKTVNFSQSGLSTVGYTLYDNTGAIHQARTVTGVSELGSSGVYMIKLSVPDEFNGVLLWDDGQSEALYAADPFNEFSVKMFGEIKDKADWILQSLAQHRSVVEPVIGQLDLKNMRSEIEEGIKGVKETIKELKAAGESANEEIKECVNNIKMPEIKIPEYKAPDLADAQKALGMIERLYSDYKQVLDGMKAVKKIVEKPAPEPDLDRVIDSIVNRIEESEQNITSEIGEVKTNVKSEGKAVCKVVDDNYQNVRTRLSADFDKMMEKMEKEGLNVLGSILKLLQTAYQQSPQGVNDNQSLRKMQLMLGPRKK